MILPRCLVCPPRHRQRPRWRDRLAFWSSTLAATSRRGTPTDAVEALPPTGSPADPDAIALRLYERWVLSAGLLWITRRGDAARRDLVEHLQRHPQLLVDEPVWRDRLVEVTVARATQVLLPPDYDHRQGSSRTVWLTDEVRDMLHGLVVIVGARIPLAITPAFLAADRLLVRYEDARTYEETPLGLVTPGRGMQDFPECDESIDAANDLMVFLSEHRELAGTREFAAWFETGSLGPHHDGP